MKRRNGLWDQSLVKNYIHTILSTKQKVALIQQPVQDELYSYIGIICKRMECPPIKIGCYTEYIHIQGMLSKKTSLMQLLKSEWMILPEEV